METKITITEAGTEEVKVKEEKSYTLTVQEIKNELNKIDWRKEDMINQSRRLKKEFDNLEAKEKELRSALAKMEEPNNGFEVLNGTTR